MTIQRSETPTLSEVMRSAIEARVTDIHTMLPGEFLSFDATTGKAKVKALIKKKFEDGEVLEIPPMDEVPVLFQRTEKSIIYVPIKAGDKCMIMFSERSLEAWKKFGGSQDPRDRRKHHLSDAVAIPGLYSFAEPSQLTPNDLESILIENDKTRIRLKPDGKIKILSKVQQVEIIDTINRTLLALIGEPFILNKGTYSELQTKLLTVLDLDP